MPTAHLILTIGNSHDIGRDNANVGDVFHTKVWQWTQAGALAKPAAAMLDHVDAVATDYSPDVTFAADYIAANSGIDRLVFVPHAKGGTGFADAMEGSGNWSVDTTPNRLTEAVSRYNAASAALVTAGFTVVHAGTIFYNANPDYNLSTWDAHRDQIDRFVAYLRSHLTGYTASIPIVIGGGMNNTEFSGRPINDALFQANLNGTHKRLNSVGTFDTINPRYGYSTGLPVPQVDSFHATRAGDITVGHLRYQALVRATANTNFKAPFGTLSFASSLRGFWDFRTGTPRDMSGTGNHLVRFGTNPPLYRVDSQIDQLAWIRPTGSTTRVHQLPMALPASYTIAVYVKLDDLTAAIAFLQKSDGAAANQHRLQYSASNSDVRAGHGATANSVTFASSVLDTTDYHLVTLTYDAATTTMKLGHNGSVLSTNAAVPAHASTSGSYLGAATAGAGNPLIGKMAFAMVANRALTNAEISELWTSANSL
jgi:hypothetical protein